MADIQMPQLGESVTEGTITKWFKQIGDHVAEDEVLFEVSTDKVDSEVPSPAEGYLSEIKVPEGETVDVGTVLAVLSDSPAGNGESAAPPAEAEAAAAAEPAPATDGQASQPAEPAEPTEPGRPAQAAPERAAPPPAEAAPPAASSASGRLMSPVVRRLVEDYGVDVDSITPSGAGGRVTRADVERAVQQSGARVVEPSAAPARPTAAPSPAPSAPSGGRTVRPKPRSGTGDTVEPLNNIRRRTAEHMVMSKETSAHAYTIVEVDYENVERVRRVHRDEWRDTEGFSLTYLPFIARAVIDALRDFPHINATVSDSELVVHNYVNLAVAVDLDYEGLLAPVVHQADDKRLRAVAREINDLAERARSKKLSVDDITGGTFTISNSGSYGSFLVLPIINQPQVAILSTDGVSRKPVVVTADDGTEAIAIHSVGLLGMSWDHRAFDGAYAAAFLRDVKHVIETRDWEAEL
jgi:2-oxoglutarate dehydrogenase E2 component (dihydrolipoamide succinyltransferase)